MFGKTNWVLKGVRGAHAHAIYVLETDVILGRSADSDIQILDQRVSRQHARLHVGRNEVILEDLGSHNGTFLHGHKVARRPLREGDRLRVGVSEYVLDRITGRVLTSAIFLNKLTNKDTMGATAVTKRVTREILTAQTAEMPAHRQTQEITARVDDGPPKPQPSQAAHEPPARQRIQPARAPEPEPQPRTQTGEEPAYLREQRERAVRLPTPLPGELDWRPEGAEASDDEPAAAEPAKPEPPARPRPIVRSDPRVDPAPRSTPFVDAMTEAQTVPLDPRSQRVPTPVPASIPTLGSRRPLAGPLPKPEQPTLRLDENPIRPAPSAPEPEENAEDEGLEAAQRTVDAVVRLLKLRAQESGGALLKMQDRQALRRLEGVLRESRRNRSNRRRWSRLPCRLAAQIGEDEADARVTDIGAGGLRVTGGTFHLEPGDMVSVRVHLGEGPLTRIAVFQTKIAWVDDQSGTFGAIFAGPAHWELAS